MNIPKTSNEKPIWWSRVQFVEVAAKLKGSSFVRNILVVMTGTAIAQIIGFGLSPIISRLFSPSDFGVFGSFSAVAGVFAAGVTLQYTQAIMLPKNKEDAINLFVVSCLCTFCVGSLCLLACLLAPDAMHRLMKTSGDWVLVLLVVGTVTSGLNQSCQAWCIRVKAFKQTSASQVIRSLSSNGTQVGLGCLNAGAPGLIASSVLADVLASLNLTHVLLPELKALHRSIRWEQLKKLAHEYRDFPIYSASQNVISSCSLGIPVLLLTHYFGVATAGAYAFAVRIIGVPMGFVLTALRQVLFQRICETQNQGGKLLPLYLKTTLGLFGIALLPSIILMLWAPQVFAWIFGLEWSVGGEFARALVIWLIFMFCSLPSTLFARAMRMQGRLFAFDLILLAMRTLVLIAGGVYLSPMQTVFVFSVIGAIMNIIFIYIVGRALASNEHGNSRKLDLGSASAA